MELEHLKEQTQRYKGHGVQKHLSDRTFGRLLQQPRVGCCLRGRILDLANVAARSYGANDLVQYWLAACEFRF